MEDKHIEERFGTEDNIVLPRFVWEDYNASHERSIKRLIKALIVAVVLLALTNLAWLWVFNQYNFSSESYTIESGEDGISNFLDAGNDGVINNGESGSEEENSG